MQNIIKHDAIVSQQVSNDLSTIMYKARAFWVFMESSIEQQNRTASPRTNISSDI